MKLRIEIDGRDYLLDLRNGTGEVNYTLTGAASDSTGAASIAPAGRDTYSLLIGNRSYTVRLAHEADFVSVAVDARTYRVRVSDARDRRTHTAVPSEGPLEVRAQMPGKIVKSLVDPGQNVQIGQGLIVVEAMKMQNEIKALKSGKVSRILTAEGATVGAGEVLLVIV
jgi:biotin carboxyl carrier protein